MCDVSEIINELKYYGVPPKRASKIAAALIVIGAETAAYRRETAAVVCEVEVERRSLVRRSFLREPHKGRH